MFAKKFVETSGVSSWTFAAGSVMDLSRKWNDDKNLTLKFEPSTDNDSGVLDVYLSGAERPSGNFTTFNMGNSGTSLVITSGTSIAGNNEDGVYLIPLTISPASGITIPLKGIPYIKINTRAHGTSVAIGFNAWLIIG